MNDKEEYRLRDKKEQRAGVYRWYYSVKGILWRKRNKLRRRLVPYNMTPEQYYQQLRNQKHRCAMCKARLKTSKTTHVDHDHKLKKNRGILCTNCNSILGFAKDNICTLRRAIKYLIKHKGEN
jgi:uncharacterized protein with PIN domain